MAPGSAGAFGLVLAYARERPAGFEAPKRVIVVDQVSETVGGTSMGYRLGERSAR